MGIVESLEGRRTVYALGKGAPVGDDEIVALVKDATRLVPDAFNMRSQRVAVALGGKQDELWDAIYDAFGGKVDRGKIDGFKAAHGTVLYFVDETVVEGMQEQFPRYAGNFPTWAQQANGMLQLAIWAGLEDVGLGANIQHYNPVIDDAVRALLDLPESWKLVAQMPFGEIVSAPGPKEAEDVDVRVRIAR